MGNLSRKLRRRRLGGLTGGFKPPPASHGKRDHNRFGAGSIALDPHKHLRANARRARQIAAGILQVSA